MKICGKPSDADLYLTFDVNLLKILYEINNEQYYQTITVPTFDEFMDNKDLKTMETGCYFLSVLLQCDNTILDEMSKLMGSTKKDAYLHLLFGNLRELYIPQGNLISL